MKRATGIKRSWARLFLVAACAAQASAVAGCGDGGTARNPLTGGGTDVGAFLGTWHYDQASGAVTCAGGAPVDLPPSGNKQFATGTAADVVDVSLSPVDPTIFCDFGFDLDGDGFHAVMTANQVCTLTGGDQLKPTTWRFTLLGPDKAEEVGGATININFTDPATGVPSVGVCQYSMMALLTRVAKD
jgi:hypothetical protein